MEPGYLVIYDAQKFMYFACASTSLHRTKNQLMSVYGDKAFIHNRSKHENVVCIAVITVSMERF